MAPSYGQELIVENEQELPAIDPMTVQSYGKAGFANYQPEIYYPPEIPIWNGQPEQQVKRLVK